jgi:hypothetical protein
VEPEEIVRCQPLTGTRARFRQFVLSMGWSVDAQLHQGWAGGTAVSADRHGSLIYYSDISMEACNLYINSHVSCVACPPRLLFAVSMVRSARLCTCRFSSMSQCWCQNRPQSRMCKMPRYDACWLAVDCSVGMLHCAHGLMPFSFDLFHCRMSEASSPMNSLTPEPGMWHSWGHL